MKKRILMFLICGVMVAGLATGCSNEKKVEDKKTDNNVQENSKNKNKKVETLKVGNYNIKYGYYKSDKNSIHIKKDGTIWMQNGVTYDYTIRDNYIVFKNGEWEEKYRVESEEYIVYETSSGEDYDKLYYYETPDEEE